jgi:eukaryotic-like serine/threonine-protein kinase
MSRTGNRLGPYTLQEQINSGGMSEIWLATDDNGQSYAVRLLQNNSLFAFTERKRFLTGCEVLQQVQGHDFMIGYVEHGKLDGELCLVMEYVEGDNLKLLLAREDPVLTENIPQILIDMATALEHVHDRGFMHLDIKPENFLLTRNGSLRLIDFDLARPIPNPPAKLDKNPGTPAYMAPEQLQRLPVDHRADIWAYGVSAYELLTTQKPFPGETADDVLRRQLDRSEFISPRELNPDVPPALEDVLLRCLETEMDRRYPVASMLALELSNILYV